jgi:Domain of unknown function (DUF4112)
MADDGGDLDRGGDVPQALAPPWLRRLVRFMDDAIAIPGTRFRVGWDAILGAFAPWVGDGISALSHVTLIWSAFRAGLPKVVFARMLLNVAIDALVGSVPILGDLFDAAFKANRRNLELLERVERRPARAATSGDYAVVALAILGVLIALTVPAIVAVVVASALFHGS